VKIGPLDTEIALLILKKINEEEITEGKIYSPVSKPWLKKKEINASKIYSPSAT